jgi:hypothetical protein
MKERSDSYSVSKNMPNSIYTNHGSKEDYILDFKLIKDYITGKEEFIICYLTDRNGIRTDTSITITGKDLSALLEKYRVEQVKTFPLKINTFKNNKGEKWTFGVGTHEQVEDLNIEKDFKTTLKVFDSITETLDINNKLNKGICGTRKAGNE